PRPGAACRSADREDRFRQARRSGSRSIPFQRPLVPLVYEPDGQHGQKDHHRPESKRAKIMEDNRPGKQERHLKIEDDEQERNQVEARVEAHSGVVKRRKPALIRRKLFVIRGPIGDQKRRDQQRSADESRDDYEHDQRHVVRNKAWHGLALEVFNRAAHHTRGWSDARPELMPQTRIAAQATTQGERLQFARDGVAAEGAARARVSRPHYIGARSRQLKGREADSSLRRAQASERTPGGERTQRPVEPRENGERDGT